MLNLTRKVGEVIKIGDDIEIMVTSIHPGRDAKVRIGISAPRAVPVHRKEVYDLLHAPKEEQPAPAIPGPGPPG